MTDKTKFAFVGGGIIFAVVLCNLSASGLTSQTAQSLSTIAMAQAMSEQAQANQQLAKAVQSVTHTMNWLLIVVLLLAVLGAGLYVWKSQQTQAPQVPPALPGPETPPLQVVYLPRPQLPEGIDDADLLELQSAEVFQALMSGKEWQ